MWDVQFEYFLTQKFICTLLKMCELGVEEESLRKRAKTTLLFPVE